MTVTIHLKVRLLLACLLISASSFAQEAPPPPPPPPVVSTIFKVCPLTPSFPGCEGIPRDSTEERWTCANEEMLNILSRYLKYPQRAINAGIEGTAIVSYIAEKDGSITANRIVRDPGGGIGAEALRLVGLLKTKGYRFNPGSSAGRPVRIERELTIEFKLE